MDGALAKKLLLKPGTTFAAVSAPPEHAELLDGAASPKGVGLVLLYVENAAALKARLPPVKKALASHARLWVAYPKAGKLGTDLNRDRLWQLLEPEGFEPVRQIALDETWSALWFKPALAEAKTR
jgi:hypothetical protein